MKLLLTMAIATLAGVLLLGCGGKAESEPEPTEPANQVTAEPTDEAGPERAPLPADLADYNPEIDPANFVERVDNPYFPLIPGTTFIFEGTSADGAERIEFKVTHDTKEIEGITATVVEDSGFVNGELKEKTLDWFAQDKDGNVWYLGEETSEYENGEVVSTFGSFQYGVDGALPGIVMPADPQVGDRYLQEFYVGEAEDWATVLSIDESVSVPFGDFENCIKAEDINPFEPDVVENKYYCPGVGNVLNLKLQGGDDRVELVDVVE
ncbi:MAG: hypothetical protein WEB00_04060 [Dehalococcoidia bacterium]